MMTYNEAKRLGESLVERAPSFEYITNWLMSEGAAEKTPIEIAMIALVVNDLMRGGRVGDELAKPEIWYYAVRRMIDATA